MTKETKNKLTPDMLKLIVNIVIDKLREEEDSESQKRYDRRRANTRILLRNYRSLTAHCDSAIYDAIQMNEDAELAEILSVMNGNTRESFRIESIRESVARTRLIIDHIDKMLDIYKTYCEKSSKIEDKRRYRVIYSLFISDITMTAEQIANDEHVELRTIYRDIEVAIERITALIFGIDGLYLLKK